MADKTGVCDLGFAKIDLERQSRRGFPEVIYCAGKSKSQIKDISLVLVKHKQDLLLTKVEKHIFSYLKKSIRGLKYNSQGKIAYLPVIKKVNSSAKEVVILSGRTADIPVAEEAAVTLELMQNKVRKIYDCGVAGLHRILRYLDIIKNAKVIIVVAGMEGALASLVSGLTNAAVIAVPTSCGYGANFAGLAPLLTMLNSCSPGIATVNIDNGFGAGYFAGLINK